MSQILPWMSLLLCVAMVAAAWIAVRGPSTPIAILASGLVGLLASVLFLILASPDVAMTEAAIGSGLTTFLFFLVLARVREGDAAITQAEAGADAGANVHARGADHG